jgi:hypothetical protein
VEVQQVEMAEEVLQTDRHQLKPLKIKPLKMLKIKPLWIKPLKKELQNDTYKTSREIGITTQYSKTSRQDIKEEQEKAFQEQSAYNTSSSIENTFSPIVPIFGPGISEHYRKMQ